MISEGHLLDERVEGLENRIQKLQLKIQLDEIEFQKETVLLYCSFRANVSETLSEESFERENMLSFKDAVSRIAGKGFRLCVVVFHLTDTEGRALENGEQILSRVIEEEVEGITSIEGEWNVKAMCTKITNEDDGYEDGTFIILPNISKIPHLNSLNFSDQGLQFKNNWLDTYYEIADLKSVVGVLVDCDYSSVYEYNAFTSCFFNSTRVFAGLSLSMVSLVETFFSRQPLLKNQPELRAVFGGKCTPLSLQALISSRQLFEEIWVSGEMALLIALSEVVPRSLEHLHVYPFLRSLISIQERQICELKVPKLLYIVESDRFPSDWDEEAQFSKYRIMFEKENFRKIEVSEVKDISVECVDGKLLFGELFINGSETPHKLIDWCFAEFDSIVSPPCSNKRLLLLSH